MELTIQTFPAFALISVSDFSGESKAEFFSFLRQNKYESKVFIVDLSRVRVNATQLQSFAADLANFKKENKTFHFVSPDATLAPTDSMVRLADELKLPNRGATKNFLSLHETLMKSRQRKADLLLELSAFVRAYFKEAEEPMPLPEEELSSKVKRIQQEQGVIIRLIDLYSESSDRLESLYTDLSVRQNPDFSMKELDKARSEVFAFSEGRDGQP